MLSTLSEMTLNSTTFSLKPVYCVCVRVSLPSLPASASVTSCSMSHFSTRCPAGCSAMWSYRGHKEHSASNIKSPSKLLLVNIQVKKKILSYSYLLFKCWHFYALFLTAVTHLAFNPSWYQLLIGQLSHSRHGGPQVPTGRRQDVTDGDAGRLVHRHGSCVVTQVLQQRWGDNFQQLLPPSCCVLFTEQSRNMWPSLHLRLLYVSITIYFYFLGLNKTVHIAVTCVRFRLPSPTPWWSPAPGEPGLWGSAGTLGPFYRTCYLRPHPEILGSPGKVGHKWVFNGDTS